MLPARTMIVFALAGWMCFSQEARPPLGRHLNTRPDPVMLTSDDVSAVVEAAASPVNSDAMAIAVSGVHLWDWGRLVIWVNRPGISSAEAHGNRLQF